MFAAAHAGLAYRRPAVGEKFREVERGRLGLAPLHELLFAGQVVAGAVAAHHHVFGLGHGVACSPGHVSTPTMLLRRSVTMVSRQTPCNWPMRWRRPTS